MITTIEKQHTIGRPTSEVVKYRQALHNATQEHEHLLKVCHERVVSLESKLTLQSNAIQRLSLENRLLRRDLNLLSRM